MPTLAEILTERTDHRIKLDQLAAALLPSIRDLVDAAVPDIDSWVMVANGNVTLPNRWAPEVGNGVLYRYVATVPYKHPVPSLRLNLSIYNLIPADRPQEFMAVSDEVVVTPTPVATHAEAVQALRVFLAQRLLESLR